MEEKNGAFKKPKFADPVAAIRLDHKKIRKLFKDYESSSAERQKAISVKAAKELQLHSRLEIKYFYPFMRGALEKGEEVEKSGREVHKNIDSLLKELGNLNFGSSVFNKKFKQLSRAVRSHLLEEEAALADIEDKIPAEDWERLGRKFKEFRKKNKNFR